MTVNVSIFYQNSGLTPSKHYYSNTRCHFRMNSALRPIRAILHLRNNPNALYQNSDLTQSKVYYSNTINQFCMSWPLLSLRFILHLRKISKHCKKLVRFFLICTLWNSLYSSNFEFKQTNSLLQWCKASILHRVTLTFFKATFIFSKKFQTGQ